jgi:ABC-type uncharacterized transport system substrate-binding protein
MHFHQWKRREFITLLGSAAAAWPLAARGQQSGRMARIGVLMGLPEGDPEGEKWARALLEELPQLGWIHDKNVRIDLRWGGTDPDRMQKLAKELIDLQPDVIEVTSTPATAAVLRQTRTIPVVFSIVSDPLGSGFVQSFVRPGGNATGFVNIEASLAGKWLALLKELVPQASRARIIFNPKTAPQADYYLKLLAAAAPALTLTLDVVPVDSADRIAAAITELAGQSNVGVVLIPDIFTGAQAQRDLIISLTARHHIPTVYFAPYMVRAGGLISYGVDFPDLQRRAARYVDRVLKGANPQDLPVQLPTRFELAVNLKTARALGLDVPPTLLALADEVIE